MKKIVVLSGAGISADSGISTFRDSKGLWAKHSIEDVCTPDALRFNRETVINFYNLRRKELLSKSPNPAHSALVELAAHFDVEIITQNIDDLHERAGSNKIIHLHGELLKLRSTKNQNSTVKTNHWEQKLDDRHIDGSLLRPHVVFFGEAVPLLDLAIELVKQAEILIVVGTSMQVYPAASLIEYLDKTVPVYLVDPSPPSFNSIENPIHHLKKNAAVGVSELCKMLINKKKTGI